MMIRTKKMGFLDKLIPLLLVIACILLLTLMPIIQGRNLRQPSAYNTYTLQAMQWRKGEIALDKDYPHLELAIYQGQYYVSFPPVPVIPIYFLTYIFGDQVPDALLIQIYALTACMIVYIILRRVAALSLSAAVWAFLVCFASSLLPLLQNGAVWYQAQVLAFLFMVAAIERMQKGRPTAGLLFFALSVGCRPFNVLYGPLLVFYGVIVLLPGKTVKRVLKKLLPGFLLGLGVAIAYAGYNYVRFGNIFEFGHNYLPEFSTQGGRQFDISHIWRNARTFVWGLPFEQTVNGIQFKKFGFSLFLANPIFLYLIFWTIRDVVKNRLTCFKASVIAIFAVHTLCLLSHRTVGGFQYGARYFVDCIPYALMYLIAPTVIAGEKTPGNLIKPRVTSYLLLLAGLIMSMYGALYIHL